MALGRDPVQVRPAHWNSLTCAAAHPLSRLKKKILRTYIYILFFLFFLCVRVTNSRLPRVVVMRSRENYLQDSRTHARFQNECAKEKKKIIKIPFFFSPVPDSVTAQRYATRPGDVRCAQEPCGRGGNAKEKNVPERDWRKSKTFNITTMYK